MASYSVLHHPVLANGLCAVEVVEHFGDLIQDGLDFFLVGGSLMVKFRAERCSRCRRWSPQVVDGVIQVRLRHFARRALRAGWTHRNSVNLVFQAVELRAHFRRRHF